MTSHWYSRRQAIYIYINLRVKIFLIILKLTLPRWSLKSNTLFPRVFSLGIEQFTSGTEAMTRSCSAVLAFVACFAAVLPFNLDVKNPFMYEGSSGEYFGYTVALHAQQNGDNW